MKRMYNCIIKRILDLFFSILFLLLASPLLLISALAVKLSSKGGAIFKQVRLGYKGKPFKMYKFRSMRIETPKNLATRDLDNPDYYITKVGRFLRNTSLDELPQLINIIKGDMSFIGPRPVVLQEEELVEKRLQNGIDKVRPGISGWAQIHGRDKVSIDEKVRLDKYYVDNISIGLDIKIFFKTLAYVLKSKDIIEGPVKQEKTVLHPNPKIAD